MNRIHFITLIIALSANCITRPKLQVNREKKVLADNETCDISFYYPFITAPELDPEISSEVNDVLYRMPDYDFYTQRCDSPGGEKRIVKVDYKILLQSDSILSIEYMTLIRQDSKGISDTVYHSLVLNTKLLGEGGTEMLWGTAPEQVIRNFDRGKLKPYVERYNETAERPANILAYEHGSDYVITWALTEDELIVYVAGEGELHGYEKIEIPIEALRSR